MRWLRRGTQFSILNKSFGENWCGGIKNILVLGWFYAIIYMLIKGDFYAGF